MVKENEEIQEERLRDTLTDAFPATEPTAVQKARILSAVQGKQQGKPLTQSTHWRLIGVATAVALLFTVIVVSPRWSVARAYERVEAAVKQAQRIHTVAYEWSKDGKRERKREIWQDGESVRTEESVFRANGGAQCVRIAVYTNALNWTYYPLKDRVIRQKLPQRTSYRSSGPTMTDMRWDIQRRGWGETLLDLGMVTMLDGRKARRFQIDREEPAGLVRTDFLVDPATDLPFRGEVYQKTREDDRFILRMTSDVTYNEEFAATTFRPAFPKTATWTDRDEGRQHWQDHLRRGIARQSGADGRNIVLRDFQVNRDGDVFLLYTAGKQFGDRFYAGNDRAGRDWRVEVTDELGNAYVPHWNVNYPLPPSETPPAHWIYDGERLEGDAWTPEKRQPMPWRPRRFTITFRYTAKNLHGTDDFGTPERTETSTFTLPVAQPTTELIPDFTAYLDGDLDEKALRGFQASARNELPPDMKASPELQRVFPDFTDTIVALGFSPDGRTLVADAYAQGMRFWDVRTGSTLNTIPHGPGSISFALSPEGKRLAFSLTPYSKALKRYIPGDILMQDARTGRTLWKAPARVSGDGDTVGIRSFSPDGKTLAALGTRVTERKKDKAGREYVERTTALLRKWDAQTGKLITNLAIPDGFFGPALSPKQDILVTWRQILVPITLEDGHESNRMAGTEVKLWDADTGAFLRLLEVPESTEVSGFTFSSDGRWIAAGGHENRPGTTMHLGSVVLIWEASTGKIVHTLRTDGHRISTLAFSPDGSLLAVGNVSGRQGQSDEVILWDTRTGQRRATFIGHAKQATQLAFSPDGRILASGDLGGKVLIWRVP
jgi:hypothetical protein